MTKLHLRAEKLQEFMSGSDSDDLSDLSWSEDDSEISRDTSPQPSTSTDCTTRVALPRVRRGLVSSSESEESDSDREPIVKQVANLQSMSWMFQHLRTCVDPFNNENSGNQGNLNEECSIIQCFQLFFTESLVKLIAEETNKFHKFIVKQTSHPYYNRGACKWKKITCEEMYCFIALCLLMPRVQKMTLREYWSKDPLVQTPIFRQRMSRIRFLGILRMLHFSDNNLDAFGDKLCKIRKVVDKVRDSFRNALDESLHPFQGGLFFRQYLPSERSRFGIKLFLLCDYQSGYVLDFVVFAGATSEIEENPLENSGDVVATLLIPYLQKGHIVYIDNWYRSPALFSWLHNRATNAFVTVRKKRRKMPEMEQKLKEGQVQFRCSNIMLTVKWCDKREVWVLTTCNTAEVVCPKHVNGKSEDPKKPQCIVDCNESMGADTILSVIESVRKDMKWYKQLFFHILDLCVLNAHVLHQISNKKKIPLSQFHLALVRELLGSYCSNTVIRLTQRHFPSEVPTNPTDNWKKVRRCIVCSRNKKRSHSSFMCKECNVGLCKSPCFRIYHTRKNF